MTLSTSTITCGLTGRATPSGALNTSNVTVGTLATYVPTAPTAACALKITAAASANVATFTPGTGDCVQTTGSPVILGSGKDFQGIDLGTNTKIQGLRLVASGSGTVTIVGSAAPLPSIVLQSGSDMVIRFPDAGATLSAATLAATFSATGGILEITAITKA